MPSSNSPTIQEIYESGVQPTAGTLGHLTELEQKALKQLWTKVLEHFEATKSTPIKVTNSIVKPSKLVADRVNTSDDLQASNWYKANSEHVNNIKTQTVNDAVYLSGKTDPIVPSAFKPLFGDVRDSRLFYSTFWYTCMLYSNPDTLLLNFLQTCKFEVNTAFDRLVKAIKWRAEQAIDELMWYGESGMHNKTICEGVTVQAGHDKFGYVVLIVRIRKNSAKERGSGAGEQLTVFLFEQAAIKARSHGEHIVLMHDYSGFKMENVDMSLVKTVVMLVEEIHPQLTYCVINSVNSWLFTGVWSILKALQSASLTSRTANVKNVEIMQSFIDKSQIIKDMGGDMPFEYKYVYPTKDENIKMFDTEGRMNAEAKLKSAVDRFMECTRAWTGKPGVEGYSDESRLEAAADFNSAALALDPYIRARFLYERQASA
ncbi:phosphatidylinositol transfer protein csr1 [Coemansia sp. Benny D115]|nr:phosphatidylinositol transfer protein csr1 [Coemansia sp. Benny D115]